MQALKRYSRIPELDLLAKKEALGVASERDYKRLRLEDVRAVREDLEIPRLRLGVGDVQKAGTGDGGSARYKWCASTEKVDRRGDIVRQNGWDFADFDKNPVVLAYHNDEMPCGRVVDRSFGQADGFPALFEDTALPLDVPFSASIAQQVDAGILAACSVFLRGTSINNPSDPGARQALGLGPYGVEFVRQKQFELSICALPMNPDTLRQKSLSVQELIAGGKVRAEDGQLVLEAMQQHERELGRLARKTARRQLEAPLPEEQLELLERTAESAKAAHELLRQFGQRLDATLADVRKALAERGAAPSAELAEVRKSLAELALALKNKPAEAPATRTGPTSAEFFGQLLDAADRGARGGLNTSPPAAAGKP